MAEFRTDPGDRSVAELEREVNRERERLSDTIDALKEKASVGSLFDQIVEVVSENGGEISRNLGCTLRDHPLPALLTGVGLVWLMASGGRPPYRSEWDEDFDDDDYYRRYGATPTPVGHLDRANDGKRYVDDNGGSGTNYADSDRAYADSSSTDEIDPTGGESGPGLGERAYETASGLRERASELAGGAQHRLAAAGDQMRGAGEAVRRRARWTRRYAAHAGHDARESVDRMMDEQPLVMGALALALGAAVGGALPRSQTEDRMFGTRASRARHGLRSMAEEQGRKVRATAGAVAGEAQAIAGEVTRELGESVPSGAELVDRAEGRLADAAKRLREAGAAEADRQHLGRESAND